MGWDSAPHDEGASGEEASSVLSRSSNTAWPSSPFQGLFQFFPTLSIIFYINYSTYSTNFCASLHGQEGGQQQFII